MASQPISEKAAKIVKTQGTKALRLRSAVLTGEDPEAVHDLRVAVRRARGAILALGRFLSPEIAELEGPLHDLFHSLGAVRDLDIGISIWVERWAAEDGGAEVLALLEDRRRQAKEALTTALIADSALQSMSAAAPPLAGRDPLLPLPEEVIVPDLLVNAFRRARRAARRVRGDATPEDVHRLRRRAKRFRDDLQFFVKFYGKEAKAVESHMRGLQDLLGAFQDEAVLGRALAALEKLTHPAAALVKTALADLRKEQEGDLEAIVREAEGFGGDAWRQLRECMRARRTALWAPSAPAV